MASLLNRAGVKKYIKERCKSHRSGWKCTSVSKIALDEIEGYLKLKINESIHKHPTLGKTFMHFD